MTARSLALSDVKTTWELACLFYKDAVDQKHLLESFRLGAPAHLAWKQTSEHDAAAVARAVRVLRAHMLHLDNGPLFDAASGSSDVDEASSFAGRGPFSMG